MNATEPMAKGRFYIRTAKDLGLPNDVLLTFFVYERTGDLAGPVLIGAFPSEQAAWRVIDALVKAEG